MQEKNENENEIVQTESEIDKKNRIFKEERQNIINSVVSGKINNIRERVAYILNTYIPARNSDIKLAWIYWKNFEEQNNLISEEQMLKLTKITTLARVRAKLQNEYKLFQAEYKIQKYRGVLEEAKKEEAIQDKASDPLYILYIDETGKTQTYLSVGSLWITDAKSAFFAYLKLDQWKKEHNIDYEFHFSEMKQNQLEQYKSFFLHFLSLFPSAGFKVIILNRTGIKDVNVAITDLSFHLINKGIAHEDTTGRAPLPRMLQVNLDNDEKGSDQLKIENLKERLISQQIEGLVIDSLEVLNSKESLYLQVVDLFIASINRKLHNPTTSTNKDKLADYILGLLNFKIEDIDLTNPKIDQLKVFNLTYQNKDEQTKEI